MNKCLTFFYMRAKPCLVGLAAEINKSVKLSNCRELSQIPPTVCFIISKIALEQVFMVFSKLVKHCQTIVS